MMKLIAYELFKIWNKRIFIFLLILLIIGNGLFFYKVQMDIDTEQVKHPKEYKLFEESYKEVPIAQGKTQVSHLIDKLNLYSTFSMDSQDIDDAFWNENIKTTIEENPRAYGDFQQSQFADNSELIYKKLAFATSVQEQYLYFDSYHQYIQGMQEKADQILGVSIFHDEDSFTSRNILKTVDDYSPLQGLPLELGDESGVKNGTTFLAADLCLIIIIFLLGFILFYSERDMNPLLHATKKGKFDILAAKLSVLTILTVFFAIIFYGSIIITSFYIHGFGDMNRYIQSMPSFKGSVRALTVKQYLIFYLLLKIGVSLLLAMIIATLFSLFKHIGQVYISLIVIVGISFFSYMTIDANSYINIVKFINIMAFNDTFGLLTNYRNINLFGYPIHKTTLTFIVGGILLAGLPLLITWLQLKNIQIQSKAPWVRWWKKIQAFLFRIRLSNTLIRHEWHKTLIIGKSLLVILLAIFICYQSIDSQERRFNVDEASYNRYASQLAGLNAEERAAFIESEQERYENAPKKLAKLAEKLDSDKIDLKQYYIEKSKIDSFLKQGQGFSVVVEQESYLTQLQEVKGIDGKFVNVISTKQLFQRKRADILNALVYTTLLLVVLSSLFAIDYRNGMMPLLRSTRYGRWKLFFTKHIIAYILSLILFIVTSIPVFVNLLQMYPTIDWQAPIQSIQQFQHIDWSVSILQYVILTSVLKLVGIWLMVHLAMYIAVLVRKQALTLIVTTALFLIPLCLQYIGLDQIGYLSFNSIFLLYHAFVSVHYTLFISLYYGVLLVIGICAGIGAWRQFNKRA